MPLRKLSLCDYLVKVVPGGAGETAQQSGTLAARPEVLHSVHSPHAPELSLTPVRGAHTSR